MRQDGGCNVFLMGEMFPCEWVSRMTAKQTDKLTLSAAVPFAERVNRVDLTKIIGGALTERSFVESFKKPLGLELGERFAQCGGNVHRQRERGTADLR
jgi:hypothetical protein